MKSLRSKASVFTRGSKAVTSDDVFETRSIRPNFSEVQTRCDNNLQKVTKNVLENFDLPMFKKRTHYETQSITS